MNISSRKILSRAVLALLLAIGSVGTSQAAEQWGEATVRSVYPMNDGSFAVSLNVNPPGCPASGQKYMFVTPGQHGVTADGAKAMLATALTAMVSGKVLQVAFSDNTAFCHAYKMIVIN
jgi:hypothetical protein